MKPRREGEEAASSDHCRGVSGPGAHSGALEQEEEEATSSLPSSSQLQCIDKVVFVVAQRQFLIVVHGPDNFYGYSYLYVCLYCIGFGFLLPRQWHVLCWFCWLRCTSRCAPFCCWPAQMPSIMASMTQKQLTIKVIIIPCRGAELFHMVQAVLRTIEIPSCSWTRWSMSLLCWSCRLPQVVHMPVVCNDRCFGYGLQKLRIFRSCSTSTRLSTSPSRCRGRFPWSRLFGWPLRVTNIPVVPS